MIRFLPYQFNEISLEAQKHILSSLKESFDISLELMEQIEAEALKLNIERFLEMEVEKVLKAKKKAAKVKKQKV